MAARVFERVRGLFSYPRGFAPRTPLHALSRAASPARSDRVARFAALARVPAWRVTAFSATLRRTMTVSAIPPRYRRGLRVMWIVMVALGFIVAIGRNFAR